VVSRYGYSCVWVAPTCGDLVGFYDSSYRLSGSIFGGKCAIGRRRRYSRGLGEVGHGVDRVAVVEDLRCRLQEAVYEVRGG
jgi:hypothetical protein